VVRQQFFGYRLEEDCSVSEKKRLIEAAANFGSGAALRDRRFWAIRRCIGTRCRNGIPESEFEIFRDLSKSGEAVLVTKEQILATAALCRLDPAAGTEADCALTGLAAQLDDVLRYMDILNNMDTDGVQPLYSPLQHPQPPRADVAEKTRNAAEILANAPERQDNFFVVPPVI
jgi:aspartyl-tRNA(Asn)/glutamyl-tRNA(Gln) amidotransferase subunit C